MFISERREFTMRLPKYPCCFPWTIPTVFENCITTDLQIKWLKRKVDELEKRIEELEKKAP